MYRHHHPWQFHHQMLTQVSHFNLYPNKRHLDSYACPKTKCTIILTYKNTILNLYNFFLYKIFCLFMFVSGPSSLDEFMSKLGRRYQIIIMFLLSANSIPVVVNHLLMAFYAFPTRHNCRVSRSGH